MVQADLQDPHSLKEAMNGIGKVFLHTGLRIAEENRMQYLNSYKERLLALETTSPIPYHPNWHYDSTMQLKPEYREGNRNDEI